MIRILLLIFSCLVFTQIGFTQDNNTIISGTVEDAETAQPLPGVNISVKGTVLGTITDASGKFQLRVKSTFPITLSFSFIGFQTQEKEIISAESKIQVSLSPSALLTEEVVVSASRLEESNLKSPVAIEKLDLVSHPQYTRSYFL